MKKFFQKVSFYALTIFILGCAIITIGVLCIPGRTLGNATEYRLWEYKTETINHSFNHPVNLILGDSRCMTGLKPAIMRHNFVNLALSGTTTFEGYSIFKRFLQHNNVDSLVIGYGIYHYIESDVLDKWTLRYQFTTMADIDTLQKIEKKYHITLDNQVPNYMLFLKRKETYYHFPTALRYTFIENLKQDDYNPLVIKDLRRDLGFRHITQVDSCNSVNREVEVAAERKKFVPNPVIISYLDSIYQMALAHHVKVFFTIPPINAASYKVLNNTLFWNQYKSFVHLLKVKYPEMYIDIETPYISNNNFGDPQHFNQRGVVFFSNYIINKVLKGKHN